MSFERIKTINGKKYSYTVERYREDGRTKYRILEYHGVDKDQIKDSFSIPYGLYYFSKDGCGNCITKEELEPYKKDKFYIIVEVTGDDFPKINFARGRLNITFETPMLLYCDYGGISVYPGYEVDFSSFVNKVLGEHGKEIEQQRLKREQEKIVSEQKKKQKEKEDQEWQRIVEEEPEILESIPKTYTSSIGIKFVLIPPGEFMMGSEEDYWEKPVHRVKISKPFYLGIYPVTQLQWKEVMGRNNSRFKGDDLPVERVSWDCVQDFIKKLNEKECNDKYRLPSEAEWEYAARAGTQTRYFFGDDESKIGEYAWYAQNSGARPPKKGEYFGYDRFDWLGNMWNGKSHPVGEKKPNPWGLYDMIGNINEWVQDKWYENYDGAPTDGSSWENEDGYSRIFRGGGWGTCAEICRSALRCWKAPTARIHYLGFRLLRNISLR